MRSPKPNHVVIPAAVATKSDSSLSDAAVTSPSACLRRTRGACSIAALFAITVSVCAFVTVFLVLAVNISLTQDNFHLALRNTADHVTDVTSLYVEQHLSSVRAATRSLESLAPLLVTLTIPAAGSNYSQFDAMYVNPSTRVTPSSITMAMKATELLADDILRLNIVLIFVDSSGSGVLVAPYSIFDLVGIPKAPDGVSVVVQIVSPHFPSIPTFYATRHNSSDGSVTTSGWMYTPNKTFNYSSRPYAADFCCTEAWSRPYVSILDITSSIGLGGPIATTGPPSSGGVSGGKGSEIGGYFSYHDNSIDITAFMKDAPMTANGRVVLVDRRSRAYLGGNLAGQAPTVSDDQHAGKKRIVRIDEVRDELLEPIVTRPALLDTIMNCTALHCELFYDPEDPSALLLSPKNDFLALFLRTPSAVHVDTVYDAFGLDLLVVVVIPSRDIVGRLSDGLITAIAGSCCGVVGLACLAATAVYMLLQPLRNAAAAIDQLVKLGGVDRKPSLSTATTSGHSRLLASCVTLKEPSMLWAAVHKLQHEMAIIHAFSSSSSAHGGTLTAAANRCSMIDSNQSSESDVADASLTHRLHLMDDDLDEGGAFGAVSDGSPLTVVAYVPGALWWTVPVTYMVLEIHPEDLERARKTMLPSQITRYHAKYVDLVRREVSQRMGVVSSFFGERIFVHFNAERRSKRPGLAACEAMLAIESVMLASCGSNEEEGQDHGSEVANEHHYNHMSADEGRSHSRRRRRQSAVRAQSEETAGVDVLAADLDELATSSVGEALQKQAMSDEAPPVRYPWRLRMVASTGPACCGYTQSASMSSFHVVGKCVPHATELLKVNHPLERSGSTLVVRSTTLVCHRTAACLRQSQTVIAVAAALVQLDYDDGSDAGYRQLQQQQQSLSVASYVAPRPTDEACLRDIDAHNAKFADLAAAVVVSSTSASRSPREVYVTSSTQ